MNAKLLGLTHLPLGCLENAHPAAGRVAAVLAAAVCLFAVAPAASGGTAADKLGACTKTARAADNAGRFAAHDDYWIDIGKCQNVRDATDQADCFAQAKDARKAAGDDCNAQLEARNSVCGLIGEEKYAVNIDPSNFLDAAGIAAAPNNYFPLIPGRIYVYRNGDEIVRVHVTCSPF